MFRSLSSNEICHVSGGVITAPGSGWIYGNPWGCLPLPGSDISSLTSDADSDGGGGFDPDADYCGTGWNQFLVPDSIAGIDVSYACYVHDLNYGPNSTMDRAEADRLLGVMVFNTLLAGGLDYRVAAVVAATFYTTVTAAGEGSYLGKGQK